MRGRPPKLHLNRSLCIWVDADRCPEPAHRVLVATADRSRIMLTLISTTKPRSWPNSAFIRSIMVSGDSGDTEAVSRRLRELALEGDVVVSQDDPLLRELSRKKILALRPNSASELESRLDEMLSQRERRMAATMAALRRGESGAKAAATADAGDD
jgi:uncharacterized protein